MDKVNYTEINRSAWNQVAKLHQKASKEKLIKKVSSDDFSTLDKVEKEVFKKMALKGKKIAQLCCNNGQELISVMKSGAEFGVGFDISDEAIDEAKEYASLASVNCDFIRTNIYDISDDFNNCFDIVYITVGTLCWFEDVDKFFKVVSRILNKTGQVFIYEVHPIIQIMATKDEEAYEEENEMKIVYSYFKNDPWIENLSLDYVGNSKYEPKTTWSFNHNISEVINSLIKNNMSIGEFNEYSHDKSATFGHIEKYQKVPMSYSIVAGKK